MIEKIVIRSLVPSEEQYNAERAKYIAEYTQYEDRGWWRGLEEVYRPDIATAKWDAAYPEGYESWVKTIEERVGKDLVKNALILKVNELVEAVNNFNAR